MKAKFIGDPAEGSKPSVPETFEAFGVTFERGKFVEIEDEGVARKLATNSHFEIQSKEPSEPAPAAPK